jgi:hypothetical protein
MEYISLYIFYTDVYVYNGARGKVFFFTPVSRVFCRTRQKCIQSIIRYKPVVYTCTLRDATTALQMVRLYFLAKFIDFTMTSGMREHYCALKLFIGNVWMVFESAQTIIIQKHSFTRSYQSVLVF